MATRRSWLEALNHPLIFSSHFNAVVPARRSPARPRPAAQLARLAGRSDVASHEQQAASRRIKAGPPGVMCQLQNEGILEVSSPNFSPTTCVMPKHGSSVPLLSGEL